MIGTESTKHTPAKIMIFFRPNKSESAPANSEESTEPSSTAATTVES